MIREIFSFLLNFFSFLKRIFCNRYFIGKCVIPITELLRKEKSEQERQRMEKTLKMLEERMKFFDEIDELEPENKLTFNPALYKPQQPVQPKNGRSSSNRFISSQSSSHRKLTAQSSAQNNQIVIGEYVPSQLISPPQSSQPKNSPSYSSSTTLHSELHRRKTRFNDLSQPRKKIFDFLLPNEVSFPQSRMQRRPVKQKDRFLTVSSKGECVKLIEEVQFVAAPEDESNELKIENEKNIEKDENIQEKLTIEKEILIADDSTKDNSTPPNMDEIQQKQQQQQLSLPVILQSFQPSLPPQQPQQQPMIFLVYLPQSQDSTASAMYPISVPLTVPLPTQLISQPVPPPTSSISSSINRPRRIPRARPATSNDRKDSSTQSSSLLQSPASPITNLRPQSRFPSEKSSSALLWAKKFGEQGRKMKETKIKRLKIRSDLRMQHQQQLQFGFIDLLNFIEQFMKHFLVDYKNQIQFLQPFLNEYYKAIAVKLNIESPVTLSTTNEDIISRVEMVLKTFESNLKDEFIEEFDPHQQTLYELLSLLHNLPQQRPINEILFILTWISSNSHSTKEEQSFLHSFFQDNFSTNLSSNFKEIIDIIKKVVVIKEDRSANKELQESNQYPDLEGRIRNFYALSNQSLPPTYWDKLGSRNCSNSSLISEVIHANDFGSTLNLLPESDDKSSTDSRNSCTRSHKSSAKHLKISKKIEFWRHRGKILFLSSRPESHANSNNLVSAELPRCKYILDNTLCYPLNLEECKDLKKRSPMNLNQVNVEHSFFSLAPPLSFEQKEMLLYSFLSDILRYFLVRNPTCFFKPGFNLIP